MTSMEEQETIITQNRADDFVSIWTSNTHDIAYFTSKDGFELIKTDTYQGDIVSAEFRVPKDRANIRKILKRQMSDEQRDAARERFISRNLRPVQSSETI